MLTPSKKICCSPFQTPSPVRQQVPLKNVPSTPVNKENRSTAHQHLYSLVPDVNAVKEFVWTKKEQRDRKRRHGRDGREKKMNLLEEHRIELEKLKKRRLERERLHEVRMRENETTRSVTLAGEFENWEKEENAFMLRQARERTKIRLSQGRPQPIDLLVQYKEKGHADHPSNYPLNVIARLGIRDLGVIAEDIKVYKQMEGAHCAYWDDIMNVVDQYLEENNMDGDGQRRRGINQAVSPDVDVVLRGKTSCQLAILRKQIEQKLALKRDVDVSYWECLLHKLRFYFSHARLQELQKQSAKETFEQMSSELTCVNGHNKKAVTQSRDEDRQGVSDVSSDETCAAAVGQEKEDLKSITRHYIRRSIDLFEEQYSPKYLKEFEIDKDITVTEPVDDLEKLRKDRQHVREMYNQPLHVEHVEHVEHEDDIGFENEYALLKEAYPWGSKYKPRKPRYFNRVHTGFVWNRYNRTHYDLDNPPPKTVMGYKFTIFYPDLIDRSATPKYSIIPCAESKDLVVIRFSAGPPYEDVAFKIVKKEWDKSWKSGYKCAFNGKTLDLWFRFKRTCYRR
ncbi:cactin-like [Haliotis rufescens]|uniref:cactin-like n=1 Tax=Haliotis rufescens TaxID=6454 RepID=UPI00201F842C|nr:cactin-like [Haliotis rufescens]